MCALSAGDLATMWADLLKGQRAAESAEYAVTRRAELYIGLGMPVEKVCDAFGIDQEQWDARLFFLHRIERANREAYDADLVRKAARAGSGAGSGEGPS